MASRCIVVGNVPAADTFPGRYAVELPKHDGRQRPVEGPSGHKVHRKDGLLRRLVLREINI